VGALKRWGADVSSEKGFPPVSTKEGGLKGGLTELPGNISSQFVSALLLAAPNCQKPSRIHLSSPLESVPYVLMTLECLQKFGITVKFADNLREYEILPQTIKRSAIRWKRTGHQPHIYWHWGPWRVK
jgi:3-phosphoshikimate 1-carboxyvinyltransferase